MKGTGVIWLLEEDLDAGKDNFLGCLQIGDLKQDLGNGARRSR